MERKYKVNEFFAGREREREGGRESLRDGEKKHKVNELY